MDHKGDHVTTNSTVEQMNREVCRWLGIPMAEIEYVSFSTHHGWEDPEFVCSGCGGKWKQLERPTDHICPKDPDFSQGAGIIRLLEEMEQHKDGKLFFAKLTFPNGPGKVEAINDDGYISRDYITTPGKLLQAVWQWSKEHPR